MTPDRITVAVARRLAAAAGVVHADRPGGPKLGPAGRMAGFVATGAIVTSFILSLIAMFVVWLPSFPLASADHGHEAQHAGDHEDATGDAETDDDEERRQQKTACVTLVAFRQASQEADASDAAEAAQEEENESHEAAAKPSFTGEWYLLGKFGALAAGDQLLH